MCRFLNTIIDDLFAFVIKMPTLHRLSVFRDDLGAWVSVSACHTTLCVLSYRCLSRPVLADITIWLRCAVFLVYLYQRWIYPVDKKRANEFGCAPLCAGQHVLGESCWECVRSAPQFSLLGCCPCVMLAKHQSGYCTCSAGTRPRQRRQP